MKSKPLFINMSTALKNFVLAIGISAIGMGNSIAPKKMDLYLLIGQSNMAGRGPLSPTASDTNPGIWVINAQNEWVAAADPLHYDYAKAVGVGPGLEFAREMKRYNPKKSIGLIPCAVGGTSINEWAPGIQPKHTDIYPYDAMIQRVKEARKHGKIKAILWHQGEQDSNPKGVVNYEQKLEAFFSRLRKDIGASDTPILIAAIGDFYVRDFPDAGTINAFMKHYAESHPHVSFVSSAGLTDKGDKVHFNSESARELGRRYANALIQQISKK